MSSPPSTYHCYFDHCKKHFLRPGNLKRHLERSHKGEAKDIIEQFNRKNSDLPSSTLPPRVLEKPLIKTLKSESSAVSTVPEQLKVVPENSKGIYSVICGDSEVDQVLNKKVVAVAEPPHDDASAQLSVYDVASLLILQDMGADISNCVGTNRVILLSLLSSGARQEALHKYLEVDEGAPSSPTGSMEDAAQCKRVCANENVESDLQESSRDRSALTPTESLIVEWADQNVVPFSQTVGDGGSGEVGRKRTAGECEDEGVSVASQDFYKDTLLEGVVVIGDVKRAKTVGSWETVTTIVSV